MTNPTTRADLVLKGGTVLTMESTDTRVQAVAVRETIEEMGVKL